MSFVFDQVKMGSNDEDFPLFNTYKNRLLVCLFLIFCACAFSSCFYI